MAVIISDELLAHTAISEQELRLEMAISLYKRRKVTLGKAAELAGLLRWTFQRELQKRRIPTNYGIEELKEDLAKAGE